MSERSEFRSRREGLRGNGVKNLNGSEAILGRLFREAIKIEREPGNFFPVYLVRKLWYRFT
jgi:hypothetical protein